MDRVQQIFNGRRNDLSKEYIVGPVRYKSTYCCDRYIIYNPHNNREDRKCQPAVSYDPVDLIRCCHGVFLVLCDTVTDDAGNINVTLVCNNTLGIVIKFVFQLFDLGRYIRNGFHLLCDLIIFLQKFDCKEAFLLIYNITSEFALNGADDCLHILVKLMNWYSSTFFLCNLHCFISSFFDSGSFQSRDGYNFTAQLFRQFVDMYFVSVLFNNIHHIDSHDHRNTKFHDLCGQIQVTLNVGTIYDVQDRIWSFINQVISGYHFLQCIRR